MALRSTQQKLLVALNEWVDKTNRNMDEIEGLVNTLERRAREEDEAMKQQIAELVKRIERLEKTTRQRVVIRKG